MKVLCCLILVFIVSMPLAASSVGEGVSNNPTPFGLNGLYNIIAADTMGKSRISFAFYGFYGTMDNYVNARSTEGYDTYQVRDKIIDASVNMTISYSILEYLETSLHSTWYIDKYSLEQFTDRADVQPPTTNGIGDLDWYLKGCYWQPHDPMWNIGLLTKLTIPTGNNDNEYRTRPRTEDQVEFGASLLYTMDLIKSAPEAPFRFHANIGYYTHNKEHYPGSGQMPFGIGVEFPTEWVTCMLEWYWAPYMGGKDIKMTNSPHYISPGVRLTTPVGFSMTVMFNIGITEDLTAEGMANLPDDWKWAETEDERAFAPRTRLFPTISFATGLSFGSALIPPDRDHDKIVDSKDKCPNDPEDYDGFEDEDGCPDPDNDKDGIPDVKDKCPNTPEDIDGYQDDDGCPEGGPPKVIIKKEKIKPVLILRGVTFANNSSDIFPTAYGDLDKAVETMKSYPKMRVEIGGHTDDIGGFQHNQGLSQRRAEAVRQYLIDKGIEESRITAVGYGYSHPLADNMTEYGRAQNRRIEFKVTNMSELDVEEDKTDDTNY
jgi:outer membrane protein OmpA-like peptidoglycan-associated protein